MLRALRINDALIHTNIVISSFRPQNKSRNVSLRGVSASPDTEGQLKVDLVLSSGFLAFASHCGFLKAVEESGFQVRGVMGTSSGALTGSLYAAGYSPEDIAHEFSRMPPIQRVCVSKRPWTGILSMDPAVSRLEQLLPSDFEDFSLDFGVGVVSFCKKKGLVHEVLDSGKVASAVAASAAVPLLFSPVQIPGRSLKKHIDGGIATRHGLGAWKKRLRKKHKTSLPTLVHIVGRSSPFSGPDTIEESDDVVVVYSAKSKDSLWEINHFEEQVESTYKAAMPILEKYILGVEKSNISRVP